jgi:hypothetical protein
VRNPAVAVLTFAPGAVKLSTMEYVLVSCGGMGRAVQKFASPLDAMQALS